MVHPDGRYDQYTLSPDGSFQAPSYVADHLQQTADGYTLTTRDHATWKYDVHGHLLSIADQNGQSTTLTYDSNNRLASIRDAAGRALTLQYDSAGHLASLSDPANQTVQYTYSSDGHLASVSRPGQLVTSYGYDASGRLQTISDPAGAVVLTNSFDDRGRLIAQLDALGNKSLLAYDDANHTTTLTDPRGAQIIDVHDERGFLIRRVSPGNITTQRTFDSNGYPASITDANGNTSHIQTDRRGNVTRVRCAGSYNATHIRF